MSLNNLLEKQSAKLHLWAIMLTTSAEHVDGRQTPNLTSRFLYREEEIPEMFCRKYSKPIITMSLHGPCKR